MTVTNEMQENKIGETFEYEGKVLIVKKSNIRGCLKCAFGEDDVACYKFRCTPGGRKDGKFVHFEEVKPEEVKKRAAKAKKATSKKAKTKEVKEEVKKRAAKAKKATSKKAKTKEVKNGR